MEVSYVPIHRTSITLRDFTFEIKCKDTKKNQIGKIYF